MYRTLQRWERLGIFDKLWALLVYHCEELSAVHWEWQAADGMLNKARFIGDGKKGGIKRASQGVGRPKGQRTRRTRKARPAAAAPSAAAGSGRTPPTV